MLFNSYIFIFLFLPITLIGYFLLNRKKRYELAKGFLVVMSLWFYAYFNLSYLFIIVGSIAVNFIVYRWMEKKVLADKRKWVLMIGLLFNIGILFYYKYYDFFIENINSALHTSFMLKHILLPLGISFFTFQQISFLADAYKGEARDYSLLDYALFVTFFPQLIAGPIVTHKEMIPQFRDEKKKRIDWEMCTKGCTIFTLGLFKKVLIADTFGKAVDWGYLNMTSLDSTSAVLVMFFYSIQLYFDFSGYCDMARGIGYLFGIEIPINFNSPYKAVDNLDFWKRWHITLNRFMTNYVYIPLGGNRKGKARMYGNLFIVFLVSGIWHGASWTFIVWGMMHGVMCVLTKMNKKWIDKIPDLITGAVTFLFFNLSIIIFRSETLQQAKEMFGKIFSFSFEPINLELAEHFNLPEFWYVVKVLGLESFPYSHAYCMIGFTVVAFAILFFTKNVNERMQNWKPRIWNAAGIVVLFLWSVLSLAGVSSFLYFNF